MLAWQGFSIPICETWQPAVISGRFNEGYLRLVSESDLYFQIRWNKGRKPESLNKKALEYLSRLEQGFRKRKQPFQPKVDGDGISAGFEWHSSQKGYGSLRYDECSSRMFMLELSGAKEASFKRLARELFEGFSVQGGGMREWRILGLHLALPSKFELSNSKLLSGHIQLEFRAKGWHIKADRWAFAKQIIGNNSLSAWAEAATSMKSENGDDNLVSLVGRPTLFGKTSSGAVKRFADENKLVLLSGTHPKGEAVTGDWIR